MGDQEKILWNFQGPLFLALEFPRDLTQFYEISRGGAFFLEFPGVMLKNEKFQGRFSENYRLLVVYVLKGCLRGCFNLTLSFLTTLS